VKFRLVVGSWYVGVAEDPGTYAVHSSIGDRIERKLTAMAKTSAVRDVAAVVEVQLRISGRWPHALLAGEYEVARGQTLELEIVRGGTFDLEKPEVRGPLDRPLAVGLPDDLAEAAADGFAGVANVLLPGRVRIRGGAIDVDSSVWAFRHCGAAL